MTRGYIPRKIETIQSILNKKLSELKNIPAVDSEDEEESYDEFIDSYENFTRSGQKKY